MTVIRFDSEDVVEFLEACPESGCSVFADPQLPEAQQLRFGVSGEVGNANSVFDGAYEFGVEGEVVGVPPEPDRIQAVNAPLEPVIVPLPVPNASTDLRVMPTQSRTWVITPQSADEDLLDFTEGDVIRIYWDAPQQVIRSTEVIPGPFTFDASRSVLILPNGRRWKLGTISMLRPEQLLFSSE